MHVQGVSPAGGRRRISQTADLLSQLFHLSRWIERATENLLLEVDQGRIDCKRVNLSSQSRVQIVVADHVEYVAAVRKIRPPRKTFDFLGNRGRKIQIRIEQVNKQRLADRNHTGRQRARGQTRHTGNIGRAVEIDLVDLLARRSLRRGLD